MVVVPRRLGSGNAFRQSLKSYLGLKDLVVCAINDAHAALSDFGEDGIAAERFRRSCLVRHVLAQIAMCHLESGLEVVGEFGAGMFSAV